MNHILTRADRHIREAMSNMLGMIQDLRRDLR